MKDSFAIVRKRAKEYRALTDAYDEELLKAHNSGHGTAEALEHLRRANGMAQDVMDALRRYQDVVGEVAAGLNRGNHKG